MVVVYCQYIVFYMFVVIGRLCHTAYHARPDSEAVCSCHNGLSKYSTVYRSVIICFVGCHYYQCRSVVKYGETLLLSTRGTAG